MFLIETAEHWLPSPAGNATRSTMGINGFSGTNNHSHLTSVIEPMWASLSLISIIFFTVGGNSLVCIAVIRERHLRNTTNYFLTSLAFTDCLVACLVMPLAVTVELIGHFPLDALACNVWLTFDVCCCTSSIWHMSVMSLDRYLTLRYPLKYGRNKRRSLMAYKIITIWLISFGICLPLFILGLVDSTNVYDQETHACFPAHRTFKIYGSIVAFFIPLIIMIVTYALTMSALQQAHSTKKKRNTRRQKMRAVLNIATMAIRWKRAVNSTEIGDDQKQPAPVSEVPSKAPASLTTSTRHHHPDQRKRASSLLAMEQHPYKSQHQRTFVSNYRLNEIQTVLGTITWHKRREKQLQPLHEKSIEQSSPVPDSHLLPAGAHAKRSHSCTPLLEVVGGRSNRRRSSSVHTLLQIRRDSAKISEELANLTAQLSLAMNNNGGSGSKRPSLSVPGTSVVDVGPPTIGQLLAETSNHQSIALSAPYLTVESNGTAGIDQNLRSRSKSADIQISSLTATNSNESSNGGEKITANGLPIPNLLVTHDSMQNLPNSNTNSNNQSSSLTVTQSPNPITRRLTSPSRFDTTCQRIKDWISVTSSTVTIDDPQTARPRCVSAMVVTENTPMLSGRKQFPHISPFTNLTRKFPRIEQLYGPTSAPTSAARPQQHLLVDDHVPSVHNFAAMQRSSVCSITSSMLTARLLRYHRPSTSSSVTSSSQQGPRKRPPRLIDGMSQASFQMVSLDTEDSSSCSSSLTHHSANIQAAVVAAAVGPDPPSPTWKKPNNTFRNLTKSSASNERKAMRVLLIIFSIFVILWTPFFVINLLSCFIDNIHPIIISISTWLGYCSSGANPIIYTIFSRAFRRAFVNILTCRKVIDSHRSQVCSPSCHSMTMSAGRKLSTLSRGQADLR